MQKMALFFACMRTRHEKVVVKYLIMGVEQKFKFPWKPEEDIYQNMHSDFN